MNAARVLLVLTITGLYATVAGGSAISNTLVHTSSASRQFTVYARDPLLSSVLCVFAERVKRGWLDRLNLRDDWRDPIIIIRDRRPTELDAVAVSMETMQLGVSLSYRIYCLTPPPLDDVRLRPALVRALCAEWANRGRPVTRYQSFITAPLPLWLIEGLTQSVGNQRELLAAVERRSVDAGRPMRASDLLDKAALPVNAAECELFQANALLFIESLLALQDGAHTLKRFLTELAAQESITGAFWTVYHDSFPNSVALEKWWSLQLAQNMVTQPAQSQAAAETVRQLDGLLHVTVQRADGSTNEINMAEQSPEFLWREAGQEWLRVALMDRIQRLEVLRAQAHPQYRAVIDRYVEAERWWLAEKLARSHASFEQARRARKQVDQQMLDVALVLDRAEQTYAPENLGATLHDQLRTPISDYLDRFDK